MIQTNKEREANGLSHKFKNLVMDNYFYSQNVFKSCLLFMRENEYPWCKGLKSSLVLRELRVIFVESINSAFFFFFLGGGGGGGKGEKIAKFSLYARYRPVPACAVRMVPRVILLVNFLSKDHFIWGPA